MIAAIHQPNYFPWLGYFDKIKKCDKFVILDDVQFPKKGGAWMNRVAINVGGEKSWLSAPIVRPSGLWRINETEFQGTNWRDKTKKTLQANYAKSRHFKDYVDFVFSLIDFPSSQLVEYNLNAISGICSLFDIDFKDKAVLASSLDISSMATQRLIDICKTLGCETYMAGGGAGYMDIDLFKRHGIKLTYQNFIHPVYEQHKTVDFIEGLSIIDYLFNRGREKW
jgi:hypothetical protein